MKREDRVEGLLARDRELMAKLKDAPDQPDLLRQRKQIKSQMNLYLRWPNQGNPQTCIFHLGYDCFLRPITNDYPYCHSMIVPALCDLLRCHFQNSLKAFVLSWL
jgi:hypothetical protein